jgi:hypothetical protein
MAHMHQLEPRVLLSVSGTIKSSSDDTKAFIFCASQSLQLWNDNRNTSITICAAFDRRKLEGDLPPPETIVFVRGYMDDYFLETPGFLSQLIIIAQLFEVLGTGETSIVRNLVGNQGARRQIALPSTPSHSPSSSLDDNFSEGDCELEEPLSR